MRADNLTTTKTEVVPASKLQEVLLRVWAAQHPQDLAEHKQAAAHYARARGKRPEAKARVTWGSFFTTVATGFYGKRIPKSSCLKWEKIDDKIFVIKPKCTPRAYYRSPSFMGSGHHVGGFLANAKVNREIREQRVLAYREAMQAGEWRDLLSDPITITTDGHVVNGQHRLAAAEDVDWSKAPNDPLFLVVWGVSPEEALHADLAKRTSKDQVTISHKVLKAATGSNNGSQ